MYDPRKRPATGMAPRPTINLPSTASAQAAVATGKPRPTGPMPRPEPEPKPVVSVNNPPPVRADKPVRSVNNPPPAPAQPQQPREKFSRVGKGKVLNRVLQAWANKDGGARRPATVPVATGMAPTKPLVEDSLIDGIRHKYGRNG